MHPPQSAEGMPVDPGVESAPGPAHQGAVIRGLVDQGHADVHGRRDCVPGGNGRAERCDARDAIDQAGRLQ